MKALTLICCLTVTLLAGGVVVYVGLEGRTEDWLPSGLSAREVAASIDQPSASTELNRAAEAGSTERDDSFPLRPEVRVMDQVRTESAAQRSSDAALLTPASLTQKLNVTTAQYRSPVDPNRLPMTPRLLGLYLIPSDPPAEDDRLPEPPTATNASAAWLLVNYPLPDPEHVETRNGDRLVLVRDGERIRDLPVQMKDGRQWVPVNLNEAGEGESDQSWQVRVIRSRSISEPTELVETPRSNAISVRRDTTGPRLESVSYVDLDDSTGEVLLSFADDDLDPESLAGQIVSVEWLDGRGEELASVKPLATTAESDAVLLTVPVLREGDYRVRLRIDEDQGRVLRDRAGNLAASAAKTFTHRLRYQPEVVNPRRTGMEVPSELIKKPERTQRPAGPAVAAPVGNVRIPTFDVNPDVMTHEIVRLAWFRDAHTVARMVSRQAVTGVHGPDESVETHAPLDALSRVQITATDHGLLHLFGPRRSVERVQSMIHELDSPTATVRMHLVGLRLTGRSGEKTQEAVADVDRELDRARRESQFLIRALMESITEVAADRTNFFEPQAVAALHQADASLLQRLMTGRSTEHVAGPGRSILLLSLASETARQTVLERFATRLQNLFPTCTNDPIDIADLPPLGCLCRLDTPARNFAREWAAQSGSEGESTALAVALVRLAIVRRSLEDAGTRVSDFRRQLAGLEETADEREERAALIAELQGRVDSARSEVAREITLALRTQARMRKALGRHPDYRSRPKLATSLEAFTLVPSKSPEDWEARQQAFIPFLKEWRSIDTFEADRTNVEEQLDDMVVKLEMVQAAWSRLAALEAAISEAKSATSKKELLTGLLSDERRDQSALREAVRQRTATVDRLLARLLIALDDDSRRLVVQPMVDRVRVLADRCRCQLEAIERYDLNALSHQSAVLEAAHGWSTLQNPDGRIAESIFGPGLRIDPVVQPDGESLLLRYHLTTAIEMTERGRHLKPDVRTGRQRHMTSDLIARSFVPATVLRSQPSVAAPPRSGLFGKPETVSVHPTRIQLKPVVLPTVAELLWPADADVAMTLTPRSITAPQAEPVITSEPTEIYEEEARPYPVLPAPPSGNPTLLPLPVPDAPPAPAIRQTSFQRPDPGLITPPRPMPSLEVMTPWIQERVQQKKPWWRRWSL